MLLSRAYELSGWQWQLAALAMSRDENSRFMGYAEKRMPLKVTNKVNDWQ